MRSSQRRYLSAVSRPLPMFLLRLIDPAGAYFVKAERDFRKAEGASLKPGGPPHQQAAVYGPGLPDGGRPAHEDERAWLARHHDEHLASYRAKEEVVVQRWGPILREAVDRLLEEGVVSVVLGDRTIEACILTFWRGDSLLATTSRGPNGGGVSLSRISRDPRRERSEVLLDYVVRAATKG
jgi:hypothetical protein